MKLDARLLRLALQSRAALFLAIASGLAGGLLLIFQARLLTDAVDKVFLGGVDLYAVRGYLLFLLMAIALRAVFAWLGEVAANRAAGRIKNALRHRVVAHLFSLGPLNLVSEPGGADAGDMATGGLVHLLTEGIETLDAYFSQYLPQVALSLLIPVGIVLVVFPLDPLSGLVLVLTGPLIPFFMVLIGSQADRETKKQWQLLGRLAARLLDALQGLVTLKLLGRSQEFAAELAHANEQYRQKTMDVLRVTFLSALVLELLATICTALVAVQIGLRLLYGHIGFEQAFFVLLLAPEFYAPLRQLALRFHAGMAGAATVERIFEILARKGPSAAEAPAAPDAQPAIRFEHVSFTYPDGTRALHELTFELWPGTLTALAGPSGSGKSTLVNLLLGFLRPTTGDIRSTVIAQQQPVAWVPQFPYLFNDSVAANLRLANPAASDADLIAAAQRAHADEFIRALPQGYATRIGERGVRLSGGQAQRLALARALLMDAPLLVLDEPSDHIDALTEAAILERARQVACERIVLLVAHRPAAIAAADQVIRLVRQPKAGTQVGASRPERALNSSFPIEGGNPSIEKSSTFNASRSSLSWLFSFLVPLGGRVLLSVMLGFATILAAVGLMGTSAYLIAAAALHPSIAALQVAIVGVRFFGLSRGVFRYLERLVTHDTTFRLLARLREWFYRAVEPLAPAGLSDIHSGDLLARVIADIQLLENFYVRAVAPPLVASLVALALSALMAAFDPRLSAVLLIFFVAQGTAAPVLLQVLGKFPGRRLLAERAHLNVLLVDALQGMADLLACGAAGRWLAGVDAAGQRLSAVQSQMAQLNGLQSGLGVLSSNLGMLAVLVAAIPLVTAGRLDGVWLPVVALLALTGFEAVLPLPQAAAHLETHRQAANRLLTLTRRPATVTEPALPARLSLPLTIQANHLSFVYPGVPGLGLAPDSSSFALDKITFSLPAGKRLGIVGPSGAGKTTLINLLLRFYDLPHAEQANLCVNGLPLQSYASATIRQQIAVIAQHTYLFSATIRENLLLARPEATGTEIEQVARQAHLHEWIMSLPQGYDTWVGEHGLRLSGGERQRLAIARALLRAAPCLFLDEPTAHLDAATEKAVLETLRPLIAQRSVVWITHRLVGMDWMDEILVLDEGCLVGRGTHQELLAGGGLYARMWQAQL